MQLEDYFNFLADDDIRLKGTRVGIETILYDYIHKVPMTGQTCPCHASSQVCIPFAYFARIETYIN